MTTLDRLQIQGIRSYGASEPAQNIDFKPPLTLILGANGSGKTTIIESLRMACTGALPPNANKGASFVNDPKVARNPTTESKGQIKMRFRTQQGVLVTVGRSFQLTNKKGDTQQFKQFDQYISYGTGANSSSTTQRCSEIDKLVPEVMGVSPAVLQNVIFCHQEDSNWVLGEPKTLKDKFDAIFASSRYSQALDSIKKLQTEHRDSVKTLEGEEKALLIHKKQAQEFRKDRTGSEEEKRQLANTIKELDDEVKDTMEQLDQCAEALAKFQQNAQSKKTIDTELRMLMSEHAKTVEKLDEVFEEDVAELKVLAQQCSADLGSSDREKQKLENDIRLGNVDAEKCENDIAKLRAAETNYRAEQITHKKQERAHHDLTNDLAHRYGLGSGMGSQGVGSSYSPVYNRMKGICEDKEAELQRLKREHELKESQASAKLSEKQRQKDRTEDELKEKKSRTDEKKAEVERLRSEIQKAKPPAGAVEEAAAQAEKCGHLLNLLAGKDAEHNQKIAQLETTEKDLERERSEKTKLKREAEGDFNQAVMLKQKMRNYDEHKQKVTKKIKDEEARLMAALGNVPPLAELSSRLSSVVADRRRKVSSETSENAKVKAQLERLRDTSTDKSAEIDDLEGKIRRLAEEASKVVCDGTPIEIWEEGREAGWPIDKVLLKLEEKKTEKQALHSMQKQFLTMINMYKKSAAKDKKCPLCKRGYDTHDDLTEFLHSLDEKMINAPSDEKKAREAATRLESEVQVMRSVQGRLSEKERLEASKVDAEKQLEDVMKQLSDKEQEEFQIDEALSRAQSALSEASELEALVLELDVAGMLKLKRELEEEKAKNAGKGSGLDRAKLEADIEELDAKISQVRTQLKDARKAKDENKRVEDERKHNLTLAREKKQKVKHQEETCRRLEQQQQDAEEAIGTLTMQVQDLVRKAPDLESEVREAQEQKRRLHQDHLSGREKLEGEVSATRKDVEKLKELESELVKYKSSNKEEKLKDCLKACDAKLSDLKTIQAEIDKIRAELQDKESGEANRREMLRNLEDQIKAKEYAAKIEGLQRKLAELADELREYPEKEALEQKQQELQEEVDHLQSTKNQKKGRMDNLHETIEKLKKTLAKPEYKNIDENHKMKSIELQTTKCAQKDLEKYYLALDKALMRYHEIKMEEINKFVKEIWQVTYKGDDIDTIQIKADLENTGNKRSHNYRLVMRHRHLAELDMRGRCSAGQKVLASLVVRMALAETFCHNCGILALDEPTSNLDERNMKGFTEALSRIVNERKQQNSSFQLVVISHDKDFIDDLARDTEVPIYYRVEKNPATQSSMITKHYCIGEF